MLKKTTKFFIGAGLLTILVLSAASVSRAQTTTLAQGDVEHADPQGAPHPNPEPMTMLLFGTGLLGVGAAARRRLQKNKTSS